MSTFRLNPLGLVTVKWKVWLMYFSVSLSGVWPFRVMVLVMVRLPSGMKLLVNSALAGTTSSLVLATTVADTPLVPTSLIFSFMPPVSSVTV